MKAFWTLLSDDRGVVLGISLLILALLLGAGVGAIVSTQTDLRTSGNLKSATQAFYIAEAGVQHARLKLQNSHSASFDYIFTAANGTEVVSANFAGGTYTVTRQGSAGNPSRIKVLSVGTAPNNASGQVEVWFRKAAGIPLKAIVANGDLRISGSPSIMGTRGGAHTNDDMQISGHPGVQIAHGLTASNRPGGGGSLPEGMDISGDPCIGSSGCSLPPGLRPEANVLDTAEKKDAYEAAHSSMLEEMIPRINPADYASKVAAMASEGNHYVLHDDGTVTVGGACGANGLCTGGSSVGVPTGWSFSDRTWSVSGNSVASGVFYSEVKVDISGSPGTSLSPWQATIVARDDIKISGSPHMKPYPTMSDALKNHLLVTGNDLDISGSIHAHYVGGAILVHQQFKVGAGSSASINGFIIAGDGQPAWSEDPFTNSNVGVTVNEISGNLTITFNADFDCLGPGCLPATIKLVTWREVF